MLHKCANSDCSSLFRSLSHGKLYLLETDHSVAAPSAVAPRRRGRLRRMERYWLCDRCSGLLTLTFEPGRGMVTVPLAAGNTQLPAAHLMQMQPAMRMGRSELKGAS